MNAVFILIFALLWSGITGLIDVQLAREFWTQFESRDYPIKTGWITHSELKERAGSKGARSYSADIRYRYEVDGKPFEGTQVRHNPSSSGNWARQMVEAHPVGAQTKVYYNPRDPKDAVLSPGMDGSDLYSVLFIIPFNITAIVLWTLGGNLLRQSILKPLAGGLAIMTDGVITRIRLTDYGPMIWSLIFTGVVSLVGTFGLGLPTDGHPSIRAAALVLFIIVLTGPCAFYYRWQRINSGSYDLVFNEASGTIDLPATKGRKERLMVPISQIEKLRMEVTVHSTSKGSYSTYAPTLWLRDSEMGPQKLAEWRGKAKAAAFTKWLAQRLNLSGGSNL